MSRRANGEGGISQRSDGRWTASIYYEDHETGEQVRKWFYGKTRTEVRKKLDAGRERIKAGAPVEDAGRTLADYLKEWRETTLKASDRKATTKALYVSISRTHLEPAPFGLKTLDRLSARHINGLIVKMRDKKLSEATIQRVFTVLRVALEDAKRDRLIAASPTNEMKQPKITRTEAKHLKLDEVASLLAAAEHRRYYRVLLLIAHTGLRRGEALGLKWSDIDFDERVLRVRGTLARVDGELTVTSPKTAKSLRTLTMTPQVYQLLKDEQARQDNEHENAANVWKDTGMVFTTESGLPVEPRNLFRDLQAAARAAGIEGVGLHTLRHSAATIMLNNGATIKEVQEVLGHARASITADIYLHADEEGVRRAVSGLSDALSPRMKIA